MPLETLKIDTADIIFGQRINFWVSAVLFVVGSVAFVVLFRRRHAPTKAPVAPSEPVEFGGHTPTPRPEAAIAARQRSQRKKKP